MTKHKRLLNSEKSRNPSPTRDHSSVRVIPGDIPMHSPRFDAFFTDGRPAGGGLIQTGVTRRGGGPDIPDNLPTDDRSGWLQNPWRPLHRR